MLTSSIQFLDTNQVVQLLHERSSKQRIYILKDKKENEKKVFMLSTVDYLLKSLFPFLKTVLPH